MIPRRLTVTRFQLLPENEPSKQAQNLARLEPIGGQMFSIEAGAPDMFVGKTSIEESWSSL